jgi:hypothetical protein
MTGPQVVALVGTAVASGVAVLLLGAAAPAGERACPDPTPTVVVTVSAGVTLSPTPLQTTCVGH